MPFANFKFPEGIIDAARKEEIIHRTTAMFVEFFGEGVRPYTMVLVDVVADGGWGRADETLTLAKMGKTSRSSQIAGGSGSRPEPDGDPAPTPSA